MQLAHYFRVINSSNPSLLDGSTLTQNKSTKRKCKDNCICDQITMRSRLTQGCLTYNIVAVYLQFFMVGGVLINCVHSTNTI